MKRYPAIDLRGGQAVRLYQGDYDQMTVYNADPVAQAQQFIDAGAKYLHVVDLDGAKDDTTANMQTIAAIAKLGGLKIEVGGGIRDEARIRQYLDLGVNRCILGTVAVEKFCLYPRNGAEIRRTDCRRRGHEGRFCGRQRLEGSHPRAGRGVLPPLCRSGRQGHHRHGYFPGWHDAGHQHGAVPRTSDHPRAGDHRQRRHRRHGRTGRIAGHALPRGHPGQVHLHRGHRSGQGCAAVRGGVNA